MCENFLASRVAVRNEAGSGTGWNGSKIILGRARLQPSLTAAEVMWLYRLLKNAVSWEGNGFYRQRKKAVLGKGTTLVVP
jgi:hypothetical protein